MLKMSSQLESIINAYKTLSKVPSVVGGRLNNAGDKVSATWSVRNLDRGKNSLYTTSYQLDAGLRVTAQSDFGIDVSTEILSAVSPKETYRAVIREETKKDVKKQYLEVWRRAALAHCIDLSALDLHGDVYADSEFGCLSWSEDESCVAYVAERKPPKSESFIKRKGDAPPPADGEQPTRGEEYVYRQDWGEQLVGKVWSVVALCSLADERVALLDHLPADHAPAQLQWAGGALLGVAWTTAPRLGLIFCTNRPGYVFTMTRDGDVKRLSGAGLAVRSARAGPGGAAAWLQRAAGGPHHACLELVLRRAGAAPRVLLPVVPRELTTADGRPFTGIYCTALPRRCFSADGNKIVFSTPQRDEVRSYVLDIPSGSLTDISERRAGSTTVLDVSADVVLATYSNMTTPAQLMACRLSAPGEWVRLSEPAPLPARAAAARLEYLQLQHDACDDAVSSFSALLFTPGEAAAEADAGAEAGAEAGAGAGGLVVVPHGGPHSSFANTYMLEPALYAMLGVATLLVNYRGSGGAGQEALQFLAGRAGAADVRDVVLAAERAARGAAVCVAGGSHGGFLAAHATAARPRLFRAAVARNPVTDLAAMFNYSDIPDWVNYRGSVGQGEDCVRSLVGHVGDLEVRDCALALDSVRARAGGRPGGRAVRAAAAGGSHGGLVAAGLCAARAGLAAAALRNPVVDLATKGHAADNYDGCAVEAGFPFSEAGGASEAQLLALRRCSPLARAAAVRAPTALLLGAADRRVPMHQGLEYARRLKANGVETKVLVYEDNHSLSSLPVEADQVINAAHWLLAHMDRPLD